MSRKPTQRPKKAPGPRSYRRKFDVDRIGSLALTPSETEILLGRIDDLRDAVLFGIAATTGIRREDVVAIRREGVDLETGQLTFYESKKRRTRTVPVSGRVLTSLRQYSGILPKGTVWLFPGERRDRWELDRSAKPRGHLSGRAAWNLLQAWLDAAGLKRRPFHALRATAYKLAKARGWSPELASALIGDSIEVAMEYYGVATPGELKAVAGERPLLT